MQNPRDQGHALLHRLCLLALIFVWFWISLDLWEGWDLSLITLRSHGRLLLDRIQPNEDGDFSEPQKHEDTTRESWNSLRWHLYTKNGPKAFLSARPMRAI